MLYLENRDLRIELLDPVADATRQGTRYCWGGYIWQVYDRVVGPLLSGPEWPEPNPSAFNGQGLPESFRHRTREGKPLTWRGQEGIGVGIGKLGADGEGNVSVTERCQWSVEHATDRIVFRTGQTAVGFSYELTRTIELIGRTVRSRTQLTNLGEETFCLQWFAHPFFALKAGSLRTEFPDGSILPENPGFALTNRVLTFKRRFVGPDDGQFALLGLPQSNPLHARLSHPLVSGLELETSFVPAECPVWGNRATFSIEPYRHLSLVAGQSMAWSVAYHFGSVLPARAVSRIPI